MRFWGAFIGILFLARPCVPQTPAATEAAIPASLGSFVQEFYDWYVPKFWKSSPKPAVAIALKRRDSLFNAKLTEALQDHLTSSGRGRRASADHLFDPFLNAGDACDRYRVGAVRGEEKHYGVDIYGVCSGVMRRTPAVTAELTREGDHWVFVNFWYPNERDFLSRVRVSRGDNAASSGK